MNASLAVMRSPRSTFRLMAAGDVEAVAPALLARAASAGTTQWRHPDPGRHHPLSSGCTTARARRITSHNDPPPPPPGLGPTNLHGDITAAAVGGVGDAWASVDFPGHAVRIDSLVGRGLMLPDWAWAGASGGGLIRLLIWVKVVGGGAGRGRWR
jgi:hypothetical protein